MTFTPSKESIERALVRAYAQAAVQLEQQGLYQQAAEKWQQVADRHPCHVEGDYARTRKAFCNNAADRLWH
ncbi:ANR family transcriptional regulator [Ferrimonas sp.]|uniref:ANR family transcriptional regulator n=1 Tax=Ferrimonas sp. TaxID=2080861 RepID=UPI003A91C150